MKSKVLLSIIVIFAVTASIFAKDISLSKAEQVAVNFLFQKSNQYGESINYYDLNISESYIVDQAYYVVNFEKGWVIVAANDAMVPVLGYNFTGDFPAVENQLESFHNWMRTYVDQVNFIHENNLEASAEVAERWNTYSTNDSKSLNLLGGRDIDPLLTSRWNQDNPYNAMCPADDQGPGDCVYVGCVATAMAEIMHYWRFPLTGEGSNSYYYYPYGTISADFGASEYDWNAMTDVISNKYVWEIAEIGFHAGVSVDMMYGWDGSGAYSQDVPAALRNHFRYQNSVQYLSKSSYSTTAWENMMHTELDAFRPIYYSGRNSDNGGHAFVCDGYQGTNYYHFNFGWSGSGNGFYSLQDVGGFYISQAMIRNIYPGDAAYPYLASGQTDLNTLVGSFTDGSGPAEDYSSGMDASWLISPQNEEDSVSYITLSFIEFNTSNIDKVRVYDGGDDSAELLGEFSGSDLPSNINSSSNQMFVTFSSNNTGEGFKIEYNSHIPTWCTSTAYNDAEGTITDGSLNFFYNNSTTCILTMGHPEATKYYIDFTEMNTEPINDKLRIYDDSGTLLGELSGDELPDPIVSETSSLMLMWSTNATIRNQGWSFDYHVDGVGFEETTVENLTIYPNPTTGILNVNFNAEKQGDMQVKLISINGQVIFDQNITNNSGQYNYSFDISNQAKGIYLLSIISDNEKIDRKIVLK